ncbi:hypothetical protein ABZX69_24315 [Streptomyces sp. NPDC004074]|uniref:hypothetical protein n=1 Tax=unclassified Streptomyces TaxID=2593676 RepID=UPI0033A083DE
MGFLLSGVTPNSWAAGDSTYTVFTTDDNPGGRATFWSYGEHFDVQDDQADGYRAVGYLRVNGTTYRVDDANGASTPFDAGWVRKDFEFAEGTPIELKVCLRDGADGADMFCSGWKSGTA